MRQQLQVQRLNTCDVDLCNCLVFMRQHLDSTFWAVERSVFERTNPMPSPSHRSLVSRDRIVVVIIRIPILGRNRGGDKVFKGRTPHHAFSRIVAMDGPTLMSLAIILRSTKDPQPYLKPERNLGWWKCIRALREAKDIEAEICPNLSFQCSRPMAFIKGKILGRRTWC